MVEAKPLLRTQTAWRRELLVFIPTRLTNARSEAANLVNEILWSTSQRRNSCIASRRFIGQRALA